MSEEREVLFSATKKDFKLDWFSGSGAGGQHRNKHQNCLRLTHVPSGITTISQTERDRPSNLRNAFRAMAKRLVAHWMGEQRKERYRASEEVLRTYHEPDNRVTDHASGKRLTYGEVVDKSSIAEMVEARRHAMARSFLDASSKGDGR